MVIHHFAYATYLVANDGETINLRSIGGVVQYESIPGTWSPIIFPATLANSSLSSVSGVNLNFSSWSYTVANNNEYFIVGSDGVNFTYNTSGIPIVNGSSLMPGYRIGSIYIGKDVVYDSSLNDTAYTFIENNGFLS